MNVTMCYNLLGKERETEQEMGSGNGEECVSITPLIDSGEGEKRVSRIPTSKVHAGKSIDLPVNQKIG